MSNFIGVSLRGAQVMLLSERAVLYDDGTLLIADVHLGKEYTFRAHTVPVPEGSTQGDLKRLSQLIHTTQARRLIILGDLFHASVGLQSPARDLLDTWRAEHLDLEIVLIRGNHDSYTDEYLTRWNIAAVHEPYWFAPFFLCHRPLLPAKGYTLAGHLHPAMQLRGKGRQQLKAPCFWFGPEIGVLPAFGSFTGTSLIQPQADDRIFVVTENHVLNVTP